MKLENIKSINDLSIIKITKINYFEKFTQEQIARMEQREK